MKEFISATATLWCITTYWLGGQEIPGIKRGYKWIRRFALPGGLATSLLMLHAPWYLVLLSCSLLCAALHLGYQTHLWKYAVTGLAIGVPALVLGTFQLDQILMVLLPCIMHTVLGWLSKRNNKFGWAWVALAMGWSIGVAYVYQIQSL